MATKPDPIKYTRLQLPGIARRDRLIQSLAANRDCRTMVIVGQAAQGKSTLAADYINEVDAPAAWMTLDYEDGDLSNFQELFVCAVGKAVGGGSDLADTARTPRIELGLQHQPARYRARIQSVIDRLDRQLYLVIDSMENLEPDAPAFDLIRYLIDQPMTGLKLILISRRNLNLPLQELKIKRAAFFLNNADLAFTRGEIKDFFEIFHGVSLEDSQTERLHKITGGWAGGLVLISQALLPLPSENWDAHLKDGLLENLRDETLQYFSEVVFSRQPPHIRDFLIKTAHFDVIDPEIAGALTEVSDYRAVFKTLIRGNLFTQAVHDLGEKTFYRYNHLFRDFLRTRFDAELSRSEKKALFIKAGSLYSQKRQREFAVRYFLLARDYERAGDAIKKIGMDMCIRGNSRDLEQFLEAFPENIVQNDPWLLLLLTLTRRTRGGRRNLIDFQTALKKFRDIRDVRGRILTLAYLIEAGIFLEHDLNEMRGWLAQGEELLRKLGEVHYYTYARTLLWLQIGFGYISGGIDVNKGLSACQNAFLMAAGMGDATLRANAGIISVLGLTTTGEFSKAEKTLKKIAPLMDQEVYPEYGVLQNLINIELCLKKGELDKIDSLLDRTREEIETYGLLFLYPGYLNALGQARIFRRHFDDAMKTFGNLWDVSVLSGNTYHRGLAQRLEATVLFHQNKLIEARRAIEEAVCSFKAMGPETLQLMRSRLMLGLVRLNLGLPDEAEEEFTAALGFFQKNSHRISATETLISLGLLAHARGHGAHAQNFLADGFRIAARHGFEHFSILRPVDIALARNLVLSSDLLQYHDFAKRLGKENSEGPGESAPVDAAAEQSINTDLEKMYWRVKTDSEKAEKLMIQTFGGFSVKRGESGPIDKKQWGGKRQKLLLKAIVVQGGREIPTEIIIDNMWPESKASAAQRNLKVALHRLRKVLEPDLNTKSGSSYVHLKDNLVSLDRELCRIDVDEFLGCRKDSRRRENRSDTEKLRRLCHRAIELYKGDFLPEEPYEPWVEMRRLALRDEYINALFDLVEIYRSQGNLEEAAHFCRGIIQAEPSLERATRELMQIYAGLGRRGEALKVYEDFKRCLMADIGMSPDKETVSLREHIRCQGS